MLFYSFSNHFPEQFWHSHAHALGSHLRWLQYTIPKHQANIKYSNVQKQITSNWNLKSEGNKISLEQFGVSEEMFFIILYFLNTVILVTCNNWMNNHHSVIRIRMHKNIHFSLTALKDNIPLPVTTAKYPRAFIGNNLPSNMDLIYKRIILDIN